MNFEEIFQQVHLSRQVWESNIIGFAIIAPSGHYIDVNQHFCKMLQRDRSEIVGKHYTYFLEAEDAKVSKYMMDGMIANFIPSYEMQKRHSLPNGRHVRLLTGFKPIKNEEDDFVCFFKISLSVETLKVDELGVGVPIVPMATLDRTSEAENDRQLTRIHKIVMTTVGIIALLCSIATFLYWAVHTFDKVSN